MKKREEMIRLRGDKSQKEIAKLLGITQQHYSLIENGKRGINPKYFERFEEVFKENIHRMAPDIFNGRKEEK